MLRTPSLLLSVLAAIGLLTVCLACSTAQDGKARTMDITLHRGQYTIDVKEDIKLPNTVTVEPASVLGRGYKHVTDVRNGEGGCGGNVTGKSVIDDNGHGLLECDTCRKQWETTVGTPLPQGK